MTLRLQTSHSFFFSTFLVSKVQDQNGFVRHLFLVISSVFNLFRVDVFKSLRFALKPERRWEREKQDSTLPLRSQIGGENGSRWQRESSITAPQGELQLKLLWSTICQLLPSSRGTREGPYRPPPKLIPAHNCHVNMCRNCCHNNLCLSSQMISRSPRCDAVCLFNKR